MTLTPSEIEDRFEEAALTLRRLPEKDKPRGYGSSWPPIVQEAKDAYGYTPGPADAGDAEPGGDHPDGAMLRLAADARARGCPHRLAAGRERALAANLHPRRLRAIDRVAALGGGASDDFAEAE